MSLRSRVAVVSGLAAAATGLAVALPFPALANFGSTACAGSPRNCISFGNNYTHSVRFNYLGTSPTGIPGIDTAIQWALDYQYDPTDLHAYRDDADSLYDVSVSDSDYGDNGILGWVECPTTNSGEWGTDPNRSCRGQLLRFNTWWYFNTGELDSTGARRRLACHEMGHTVGLRHWDDYHTGVNSCMLSTPLDAGVEGLSTHEIDTHINPYYS